MTKILVVCGGAGRGLLGQREALGFAAELQLDVQHELLPQQNDQLAWRLQVDSAVLSTKTLLTQMKDRYGEDLSKPAGRHACILHDGFPVNNNLDTGLGQSPAIGGGVIRNVTNEKMLRTTVTQMVQKIGHTLGQDNQLDVWIVSSTAGGTGAGIRRRVSQIISEEVGRHYQDCVVKLHFLLYGARTYNAVNAHQTALNTFFSVAQDAAFIHKDFNMTNQPVRFFYYLEIPDVGRGEPARRERERLVEITARAVFLDALRKSFEVVANNTPNKTVFVRVGFWGGELPRDQLYYETLRQLTQRLGELTKPNPSRFTDGYAAKFDSPELVAAKESINGSLVSEMMARGWRFPNRGTLLRSKSQEGFIAESERALDELLRRASSPSEIAKIMGSFVPESAKGVAPRVPDRSGRTSDNADTDKLTRPLSIVRPSSNIDWSGRQDLIIDAHRVKAWCEKLLHHPDEGAPLAQAQQDAAERCAAIQHQFGSGSKDRVNRLYPELQTFLDITVRLRTLKDLLERANAQLDEQQAEFLRVKAKADEQQAMMLQQGIASQASSLVLASDLVKPVSITNNNPWIEMLDRAAQSRKDDLFRVTVESGAIGLTKNGLARVLGIAAEDDWDNIRAEVMNRAGGIVINGEKTQGIWWQANSSIWNSGDDRYQYRIFPWMSDLEWAALRGPGDSTVEFLRTKMGAIGLRVLAMDMVNVGKRDLAAAAELLLRPLKAGLETELDDWPADNRPVTKTQVTTGVLHLAAAGVGDEPLDRIVLERLRLTPEQINKLAYLYELQSPREVEAPKMEPVMAYGYQGQNGGAA